MATLEAYAVRSFPVPHIITDRACEHFFRRDDWEALDLMDGCSSGRAPSFFWLSGLYKGDPAVFLFNLASQHGANLSL